MNRVAACGVDGVRAVGARARAVWQVVKMHHAPRSYSSKAGEGQDWYRNEASRRGLVQATVSEDVTDYANFHEPVGRLCNHLPSRAEEVAVLSLSDEQLHAYQQDGYVGNVRVLTEEQCDLLLDELQTLVDPQHPHPGHGFFHEYHANQSGDPNNVLLHALGHWRITPGFHDLVFMPSITVPGSQLILGGSKPPAALRFWHDQLFCKVRERERDQERERERERGRETEREKEGETKRERERERG